MTIAAVCYPPRHLVSDDQFNEFFDILGGKFLAGGDYSSKHPHWGSRIINQKGRELFKAVVANGYKPITSGNPTYCPSDIAKIPDPLDFFYHKRARYPPYQYTG